MQRTSTYYDMNSNTPRCTPRRTRQACSVSRLGSLFETCSIPVEKEMIINEAKSAGTQANDVVHTSTSSVAIIDVKTVASSSSRKWPSCPLFWDDDSGFCY
jgi:hypothetical protein